jgi:hypothetical protein
MLLCFEFASTKKGDMVKEFIHFLRNISQFSIVERLLLSNQLIELLCQKKASKK